VSLAHFFAILAALFIGAWGVLGWCAILMSRRVDDLEEEEWVVEMFQRRDERGES
jgi:hypothetical protein